MKPFSTSTLLPLCGLLLGSSLHHPWATMATAKSTGHRCWASGHNLFGISEEKCPNSSAGLPDDYSVLFTVRASMAKVIIDGQMLCPLLSSLGPELNGPPRSS